MKAAILGGAGAMAAVVIRDLLEFAGSVSICVVDRRAPQLKDPRVTYSEVNLENIEQTARAIKSADIVLNCASYSLNVMAMKACLLARKPYLDLGGLYHETKKQFLLHEEFVSAGIPAVLGIGASPGITNMMAGFLAKKMENPQEIHVRVCCYDTAREGLSVPYSLDTILDEFSLEPMIFTDGKEKALPPFSGIETIEFPEPAGRMEAFYCLHSEVAMFPRSFPSLKECSFKIAYPLDFFNKVKFLVELGFASREEIFPDVSPRKMLAALVSRQTEKEEEPSDCDVLQVTVKGEKVLIAEAKIFPHREWKISAGALDTGVPISIVGQMIARGIIRQPGVHCPETIVPSDLFFAELKKRSICVEGF